MELDMNKILIILSFIVLASCGPSQKDKNIAAVTCSIMSETRNMDAAIRVEKMNDAREKIGGEPFLRGDSAIQEAFEWGLCQELVLNESYDEILHAKREQERKTREKQRIADSKPTVNEEFYASGKLKSRINCQPKSDGGKRHCLAEGYLENGQLFSKINYKDGNRDGLTVQYYGQRQSKSCYKNDKIIDMSYCEK